MPTTDQVRSELPDREKLKSDAVEVIEAAKDAGRQRLETEKNRAAEQVDKVAGVMEQASAQLQQSELGSLADYAGQVANSIKGVSDSLRNRSIDELLKETQSIARRNPTLFLFGSVAVGLAIARFLKASAGRPHEQYQTSTAMRPADHSEFPTQTQSASLERQGYTERSDL